MLAPIDEYLDRESGSSETLEVVADIYNEVDGAVILESFDARDKWGSCIHPVRD